MLRLESQPQGSKLEVLSRRHSIYAPWWRKVPPGYSKGRVGESGSMHVSHWLAPQCSIMSDFHSSVSRQKAYTLPLMLMLQRGCDLIPNLDSLDLQNFVHSWGYELYRLPLPHPTPTPSLVLSSHLDHCRCPLVSVWANTLFHSI